MQKFKIRAGTSLVLLFFLFLSVFPVLANTQNTDDEVSGDIFGRRGRYFHPSLAIGEEWSDNVYNTNQDEIKDYYWVISPGIWLSLPGTPIKAMDLAVSPRTPAGFTLSRTNPERFRQYQLYFSYGADIYKYKDLTEEDRVSHKLEGLFRLNFTNGLTFELLDQYVNTFDQANVTGFTRNEEYKENLFNAILTYDFSEKFKLRFDFTHVDLDYEDRPFDVIPIFGRDRQDIGYSGYLFFKVRPKTSIFAQYRFIDIDYDLDLTGSDSEEHHYFGGVEWRLSPKSKGRLKVGYGYKDFDKNLTADDDNYFILEGDFSHLFTAKTSLSLAGFRRTEESSLGESDYILTHGASAQYNQRFTEKLSGHLFLSYAWDHYQGEITFDGETKERKEDIIQIGPSLGYQFTRWLKADAAYVYTTRDSNFDFFDFEENRVSFTVSVSLFNR